MMIPSEKLKELKLVIKNLMNQKELDDLRLKSLYSEEQSLKALFTNSFFSDYLLETQNLISLGNKEKAIQQIGRFRNFSLEMMSYIESDIVILEDEIDFIEGYIHLVKLHIDRDISLNLLMKGNIAQKKIKLPPLLLFPLVHNFFIKCGILNIKQSFLKKFEFNIEVLNNSKKELIISISRMSDTIDNSKMTFDSYNNFKSNNIFLKKRISLINKSKNSSVIKKISLVSSTPKSIPVLKLKYY